MQDTPNPDAPAEDEEPVRVIELGKRREFTSKKAEVPRQSSLPPSVYFFVTSFGTMGQAQFRVQEMPQIPNRLSRTAVEFKFRPMVELVSGMAYRLVFHEGGRTRVSQGLIPQSDIVVGYVQTLIARPRVPGCRVWVTLENTIGHVVATSTSVQIGRQR